jgi:N-acetyl-alpha-D-muramate 1-phosphate uridylyltransferase
VTPRLDLAGVVLAAGLGTRLRPLTEVLPKALCPVAGEALVDGAVRRLRHVGIIEIAVNVHHHRERMVAHLAPLGVHVSVEEGEPLGTAGALGQLRDWIAERPIVVHNADAWFAGDLGAFVEGWDGDRIRLLTVAARPGLADFGDRTFAGVSLLPWWAVAPLEPVPSGLWEVSWRDALAAGKVELVDLDGPWFDTGTPANYLAANLAANGGSSVIAPCATVDPSATVERSVVWAGAVVRPGEHLVEQIRAPGGITVDASAP